MGAAGNIYALKRRVEGQTKGPGTELELEEAEVHNNLQVVCTGVGARRGLQGTLPQGEDRSGTAWAVP